jgi:hypothetical protein
MDDQAKPTTRIECRQCGQSFHAASEASPAPKFCSPKCAGSASSARRKGQSAVRRKQGDSDQDTNQVSGPSLAAQVEELIAGGYLPQPTIRLAIDDQPVWSFGSIAGLFELPAHRLIDVLRQNGPQHLPDDKGIPSSWHLLETFKL